MITFFYAFLSVFVWNEIYYIFNKNRLNLNFKNKDIKSITKLDVLYYFTKVIYWGWIITGFFSNFYIYFIALVVLALIKFPLYHINKKLFAIYDVVLPILSICVLIAIMLVKFL